MLLQRCFLSSPLIAFVLSRIAFADASYLETTPSNQERVLAANLSSILWDVACPGETGNFGFYTTYLAIEVSRVGDVPMELLQVYLSQESRIQASLCCDPGQRLIQGLPQPLAPEQAEIPDLDFEYDSLSEGFYVFEVLVARRGLGYQTLLDSESTQKMVGFATNDIRPDSPPCSSSDFFDGRRDDFCNADRSDCYCSSGFIDEPARGVTEAQFAEGLNVHRQDFEEKRKPFLSSPMREQSLANVTNFEIVRELVRYECSDPSEGVEAGAGFDESDFVMYLELDPCSLTNEQQAEIELRLLSLYNELAFATCDGSFPRVFAMHLFCEQVQNPTPSPEDACFPWIFNMQYMTSNLTYSLFDEEEDAGVRDLQRQDFARQKNLGGRGLFTFRTSQSGSFFERLCFCSAFGPSASEGPTLSLSEFSLLALDEIEAALDQAVGEQCIIATPAVQVDCEASERTALASFETFLYLDLESGTDEATLTQFVRDGQFLYNENTFLSCREEFFQVLQSGVDSILDNNRFVLGLQGLAYTTQQGFPLPVNPFQRTLEFGGLIQIDQEPDGVRLLAQKDPDHGARSLSFLISSGDRDICYCQDGPGAELRNSSLPTAEEILPSFHQLTFVRKYSCPNRQSFQKTLNIAVDKFATDRVGFATFLKDFFNDLSIGRLSLSCTSHFVFSIVPLADAVPLSDAGGVLSFSVDFVAYAETEGDLFSSVFEPNSEGSPERKLNSVGKRPKMRFESKGEIPRRDNRLLQAIGDSCYCNELATDGPTTTPFLPNVNNLLNEALAAGGLPGVTKARLLADNETVYQQITNREECPNPDELFTVNLGVRLESAIAPSNEWLASNLRKAYTYSILNSCDSPFFRAILPESPEFLFFDEVAQVAMFKFTISSRGRPDPATATDPPRMGDSFGGKRRLAAEEVLPFCKPEEILGGVSTLDERCSNPEPPICGDCGEYPEDDASNSPGCSCGACERSVCGYDSFCCDTDFDNLCVDQAREDPNCRVPCLCPYDGCFLPLDSQCSMSAPTELEVSLELSTILQNAHLNETPPTLSPVFIEGPARRALQTSSVSVQEYNQQNCSSIELQSYEILIVLFVNVDPQTLTTAQIEFLENLTKEIINNHNADTCEPSFSRVIDVEFVGGAGRRLMDSTEWEKHRRLNTYDMAFLATFLGGGGASEDFYGSSFNAGRRLEERRSLEPADLTFERGERRLITQNISGILQCFCPSHGQANGTFITLDILLEELNESQNLTNVAGIVSVNSTDDCDNNTITEDSSTVIVTLPKPFVELTEEEKFTITSRYILSHNSQTLANCGPNSTFVHTAVLVPFPFVEEDNSNRRKLTDWGFSNGAAIEGLGSYLGGGGDAGENSWYGESNFRRLKGGISETAKNRFAPELLHDRALQESALCFCGNEEGQELPDLNQIILDINDGLDSPLVLDAAEVGDVACEGGAVYVYDLVIVFSEDPDAEQQISFEELFIAECNFLSSSQCDEELWILLSFSLLGPLPTRELREGERRDQDNYGVEWGAQSEVVWPSLVADGGASADTGGGFWLTAGRRRLAFDGITAEIRVEPHSLRHNGEHGGDRLLQDLGTFDRNFTGNLTCTCLRSLINETGLPTPGGDVSISDVNTAVADAIDKNPSINLTTAEIDTILGMQSLTDSPTLTPTQPPTSSPTDSPSQAPTQAPTSSPSTDYPTWFPTTPPTQSPSIFDDITPDTCRCEQAGEGLYRSKGKKKSKDTKETKKSSKSSNDENNENCTGPSPEDGFIRCGENDIVVLPFGYGPCNCDLGGRRRHLTQRYDGQRKLDSKKQKKQKGECNVRDDIFDCPSDLW